MAALFFTKATDAGNAVPVGQKFQQRVQKENADIKEEFFEKDPPEAGEAPTEEETPEEQKTLTEQKASTDETAEAADHKIRVLIKNQNYESSYHKNLCIRCNSPGTIEAEGVEFAAGEELHFDESSSLLNPGESLTLIPEDTKAGFTLLSLERETGHPTYEGSLTVYRDEKGYYLVNTLDLETYLCYVIPSEMPSEYATEALAAQAVCARTYAWKKISEGGIPGFNADVDDSVSYQVYNNISRQESTDAAVQKTKGKIITCEGQPITAYFFSTSGGNTSTDVWSEEPVEYLQCVNTGTIESQEPWYRWTVVFSMEELNRRAEQYKIGTLQELRILQRSDGGAVTSLELAGAAANHVLQGEYDIRKFLGTDGIRITRNDGSIVTDMKLLPSAYLSLKMTEEGDGRKSCRIEGGGYGHGVGMSQNAARHLAESGFTWEGILHFFYAKIDLTSIL
ncbi:MAG: SpoIID/LytB domain-containing protein [Lachnospiraceae bacterium]|nr:SpoIID/LytB domain-containing protein [Lachnospiraceae bacterium]